MEKFAFAHNPLNPKSNNLWVIHLITPQAHIQCLEGHVEAGQYSKHFKFRNKKGIIENWTLSVHFIFSQDHVSITDRRIASLLNRAWHWFRAVREADIHSNKKGSYNL